MAQPNIVPRTNEAESLGKSAKKWLKAWLKDLFVSGTITDGTYNVTVAGLATSPLVSWSLVSSGSASCADNTVVYLATITGVAAGDLLFPMVGPSGDGTTLFEIWSDKSAIGIAAGEMIFGLEKTATTGQYRLYAKQRSGANATLYWKVYKAAA